MASHLPNIAAIIEDGVHGRLAEPDNADAFAIAITELLAHPQRAQELANQAYNVVQQRTWTARAQRVIQFIEHRLEAV